MALFPSGPGGGDQVNHGHKGKGVLIHLLIEKNGHPIAATSTAANGNERNEVEKLLDLVPVNKWINDIGTLSVLEADKGYDSSSLRQSLVNRRILPVIPYRKNRKDKIQIDDIFETFSVTPSRWKVERAIAWIKRKSRRLLMRWERKQESWMAFIRVGLISYWLNQLLR